MKRWSPLSTAQGLKDKPARPDGPYCPAIDVLQAALGNHRSRRAAGDLDRKDPQAQTGGVAAERRKKKSSRIPIEYHTADGDDRAKEKRERGGHRGRGFHRRRDREEI